MRFERTSLPVDRLRSLTVDPENHPRGQPHLSAASGLVCLHGRAYVLADDEHHLAVFDDARSPGALHRVVGGTLPAGKGARKRRKADFESLLYLPGASIPGVQGASGAGALIGLGSGSRPNRRRGVWIALGDDGSPARRTRVFDLAPLYSALEERLDEVNIEGAFLLGSELVLLRRGGKGAANLVLHYRLDDFLALVAGRSRALEPSASRSYRLGKIDGVPLGFTDGAALDDGRWVFTAVAEATVDAYVDGGCHGSAVGVVAANGRLQSLHRLAGAHKAEGIDARLDADGIALVMVTDADDPDQASSLLGARL